MFKTLVVLFTYFVSIQSIIVNKVLCDVNLEKNISNGVFMNNNSIEFEGLVYDEENYVFYNYTEIEEYVGCPCNFNKCFRKCCPVGEALNEYLQCISMNTTKELDVYVYKNEERQTNLTLKDFVPMYGSECDTGQAIEVSPGQRGNFYFQEDGSLRYVIENYEFTRKLGEFCIDFRYKNNQDFEKMALVCMLEETEDSEDNPTVRQSYGGLMILTAPFLLATFFIYTLIPELRQTTQGKCIACYSISHFVATTLISIIYLFSDQLNQQLCVGSAFMSYAGYMASFFWLNVMCIDIWLKFRESKKNTNSRRFTIFSIYAWGSAILSLTIALVLQYMNRDMIPSYIVRPEIGVLKCWFANTNIQGYYMYGPILVIVLTNCFLFVATIRNVWKLKTKMKESSNKIPGHVKFYVNEFSFYLILFFAFGLNWGFEIIPWLISVHKIHDVFKIFDVINMLYGIFLFILACCNKKVWGLLKKNICCLNKKFPNDNFDTVFVSTDNNYPVDINLQIKN